MPKCKLCGQKKEFYNELGYCDECLDEIRAFLKTSKQRLNAWKEESLEAGEERRAEIGAQAMALEESLQQYEKRGVALNRKEYRALPARCLCALRCYAPQKEADPAFDRHGCGLRGVCRSVPLCSRCNGSRRRQPVRS